MTTRNVNDWHDVAWDFDIEYAYEQFYGKTDEQIYAYFVKNLRDAGECIYEMPSKPFMYYFPLLVDFVCSNDELDLDDLSSAAELIYITIEKRLTTYPDDIADIFDKIRGFIEMVAKDPLRFDLDPEIYGEFMPRYLQIVSKLQGVPII